MKKLHTTGTQPLTEKFKGVIFDLDGVITQTAQVHFKAWKKTFESFLKKINKFDKPFTYEKDYVPYVDGKPRYEGVQSFMESRNIELPFGDITDKSGKETICGIGNSKNDAFRAVVIEDGVQVYDSTVALVKELKEKGIKLGVASSSKNCCFVLEQTGLIDLFETIVDGNTSKELNLRGKPEPDIFIKAAENLGLKPGECIMVEDAFSGVEAGKKGNFALVLGITRTGNKEALLAHGADIVVNDIEEITLDGINNWFSHGIANDGWNLTYYGFDPPNEKLRETLTTIGNGYFGCRGAIESGKALEEDIHYPGTYIANLFNKIPSKVHDKTIYNNDFVNCPNWLPVLLKIGNSEYINPVKEEILSYKQNLDIKNALLYRKITFKDKKGQITTIESKRFTSMHNPHYAAIKYTISPHNYSDNIMLKSALDGNIINFGVARYRSLNSKHLEPVAQGEKNNNLFLNVKTNSSNVDIIYRAQNIVKFNTNTREINTKKAYVAEEIEFKAKENTSYTLEKIVSIYTSKDKDIDDYKIASENSLENIDDFDGMFNAHIKEWAKLWEKADFQIEGDRFAQKTIRLHTYHLLNTASPHNKKIDAGMPARGLSGEAYRGHIFWDELYIFPFYNIHFPDITKSLLKYRFNRLDGAREYAKEFGYKGAMYPWQTADGAVEETQSVHYNPNSDTWGPDLSRRQRHVSIAIAYNVLEYYKCTGNTDFFNKYGAEMLIDITRFWTSIAEYDKNDKKYHIKGVMGPDEFHEKYKGASDENAGIKDNAYTNVMVSWLINKTTDIVKNLPQKVLERISSKINFNTSETDNWNDIASNLNIIFSKDEIMSQYDGYFDLKELDWNHYKEKYGNIGRMDRILKSENDSPDNYKVAKQADTLMMFYLLTPAQVKKTLNSMGYNINDSIEFMKKNYDYYIQRTSHGSTLSQIVHSAILKYIHGYKNDMWERFMNALKSDVAGTQGGTTIEGIHCGVMAGTVDIIVKAFAGITCYEDGSICINPNMPKHWNSLSFKLLHRNNWVNINIDKKQISIKDFNLKDDFVKIISNNKEYQIENGKEVVVDF